MDESLSSLAAGVSGVIERSKLLSSLVASVYDLLVAERVGNQTRKYLWYAGVGYLVARGLRIGSRFVRYAWEGF